MSGIGTVIPYEYARTHSIVALDDAGKYVNVAVTADTPVEAIAEARRLLGKPVLTQRLDSAAFARALARAYAAKPQAHGAASAPTVPTAQGAAAATTRDQEDLLLARDDDGPAVQWVNRILVSALNAGASDIHLEPYEGHAAARLRVDGQLREVPVDSESFTAIYPSVVARLKVMAQLDLAERRLPQDGRLSVQIAGRMVDVRMSTLPCAFGERVVLRLLDKSAARLELPALGLSQEALEQFRAMLAFAHGIVLVTGPTGSGKTTTLYAALSEIAQRTRNVMTVEDPIEYSLPGIAQTAVQPGIGLTFARALRSILRQDPDVILIGEIRDAETAQIAVQASLTGHLVLATLHTNDAVSAVTRLVDMGIEPYLLSSCLRGVLAQRLVRKLCAACREPAPVDAHTEQHLRRLGVRSAFLYAPRGCPACHHSGYVGRTGVYEALAVTADLRRHIHARADEDTLRRAAVQGGMVSLRQDAARWLEDGTTSLEEVLRIGSDLV